LFLTCKGPVPVVVDAGVAGVAVVTDVSVVLDEGVDVLHQNNCKFAYVHTKNGREKEKENENVLVVALPWWDACFQWDIWRREPA
jgi:hypothetical protein